MRSDLAQTLQQLAELEEVLEVRQAPQERYFIEARGQGGRARTVMVQRSAQEGGGALLQMMTELGTASPEQLAPVLGANLELRYSRAALLDTEAGPVFVLVFSQPEAEVTPLGLMRAFGEVVAVGEALYQQLYGGFT
jgi:hypothetical protein